MRALRIDDSSPYQKLIGVGGLGTGIFFSLEGDHTLGRHESRPGRLLDVRDYCKLHIVIHYVAKLLGARASGVPFHVVPVGNVGADAAGEFVRKEMSEVGIDTGLVRTVPRWPTLFSVCFQYPDGSGGNITCNNSAAAALCESDLSCVAEQFRVGGEKIIALAVPEVPLMVRRRFLELATRAGAFRAASFVVTEIAEAKESGMLDLLDLVCVNESEAAELFEYSFSAEAPSEFLEQCQRSLRERYQDLRVVVSTGKEGAYAVHKEAWNYCPAVPVQVRSTAGAGDCLLGGILAAVAAGIPFLRPQEAQTRARTVGSALEFGVLLASYKCLSPHSIHPGANLETVVEFANESGIKFSQPMDRLFLETNPGKTDRR